MIHKQSIQNIKNQTAKLKPQKDIIKTTQTNIKVSFAPISAPDITILILGTMPGDKSLECGEYYGHPRNRFWKIISTITKNKEPHSYSEKQNLLLKSKIGIWDVAHKVNRSGSLDSAIKNERPNDLETFISTHKKLTTIAFNGAKVEAIFNKYFDRKDHIKYFLLPSSSPANTSINFGGICKIWQKIISDK